MEQAASENYRQAQEGATRSAKENETVAEYLRDMQGGEDAQTALNGLVSQLFVQSQQEWMRQNPDADLDEAMQRFADALKRYRTENTALSTALEGAGFAAGKNGDMNTALSYAADQLLALEERTGEEAGVQYSFKDDTEGVPKQQTETKQFDRFFGDSVITEDGKPGGKPKVMYHGTNAYEEFTVFKSGKKGYLGPGIYLTDKENRADYYAKKNGGEGRVYKVYVSMQNPLILTNEQNPGKAILHTIYGNDTVYNKRAGKAAWDTEIIKKADIEKLKAMGYDGIISNTEYNNYHESEVMAFEPTQLKSAMDGEMANIGTFDKNNPDIRYSMKDTGDTDLDMKDEDVARSVEDDAELFAQVTEDQDAREALELVNKLDESTGELTKGQWESRRGDVADPAAKKKTG